MRKSLAAALALSPPSILLSCLLLTATVVQAQEASPAASFEERILNLERSQAEIYHTLTGQKEAGLASRIAERITLSGLLEVEAAAGRTRFNDGGRETESGMSLATAYLAFGAKVDDNFSADLSFLYEEGDTPLEVDEATINYRRGPWNARFGQQYLPFGVYYSHFISDPLTLELGETRATALLAGFENDLFSLSGFVFDGAAGKENRANRLDDWGASLTLTPFEMLTLGGSYLSDLADTDAELLFDEGAGTNEWTRRVGGWSAFAILTLGDFDLAGEYLGATRAFADNGAPHAGLKPEAWNIEAGYKVRENVEFALRYEESREFFDQPKEQYGAAVSWGPREQVSLSLEYLRGKFDDRYTSEDRIADKRDLVTVQLALQF
jgi:hypothetical protein